MSYSAFTRKNYSSEGFILARRSFGEADRIIVAFTRDFGKLSLIAKGVRRPTSRKRGGLEIFSYIKFSAVKGKSLDILTEVEVIDQFGEVRKNLKKVSVGYYFCEVIGRMTRENEVHKEVFEMLKKYFNELRCSSNLKALRLNFVKEVLVTLGFWPHDRVMENPDLILESIVERKLTSPRVGKKMLQQD